jgi:alpha-L-fucosidase 2
MKNTYSVLVLFLLSVFTINVNAEKGGKLKLWYDKPATVWNEALPIGNGRISAMVFGDPANEKLQLNESTFWSGGPSDNDNPLAKESLTEVRKLIFEEKYREADNLANQTMTAKKLHGSKFQVIGNLNLAFPTTTNVTDYYRELDIQNALFTVTYTNEGVQYKREVFSSIPDQVIVMRLTASKPGKITFTAGFDSPLSKSSNAINANTLEMTGLSSDHEGVTGQVKFDARAKILNKGGKVSSKEGKIEVSKANEVVIMISMATNFVDYKTLTANEVEKCISYLANAQKKSYPVMLKNHIKTFRSYFDRVSFDLGTSEAANQPTDVRIKNFSKSNDPSLVSMYFQFGRYLLISSSQPGGQPANLQGIWNGSTNPAWDSKYTININTEMNYWPAEKCNMTEMHEPLVKMIKELSETGSKTAKNMYGCDGWVAHHNTDIWRICGVVDFANAGLWPMGGAWLSQHLWEKYLYSGDLKYLESVYPIMLSACKFYKDFLCEEPTNKWLVVSPSVSPENTPQGHPSALSAGTTMDNQLVFDIFSKTIKAAKLLNKDKNLTEEFKTIIERLPPMQVGKYGQLQEWIGDWDNPNDKHRHVSHLYGLYPGNQINPYTTPELFDAARTSLIQRGDVSTGWSMGWKVNLWARLLDGNHAFKLITDQLTLVDPVRSGRDGGTYPNFFDAHPPFQIDGNFGCTAGISEMLLQCQNGAIHLLPALPDAWSNGSISGLRAIGGFEVSFTWENNKVRTISIKSNNGGNCRLRIPNKTAYLGDKMLTSAKGDNINLFYDVPGVKKPLVSSLAKLNEVNVPETYVFDFETEKGKTYLINTNK